MAITSAAARRSSREAAAIMVATLVFTLASTAQRMQASEQSELLTAHGLAEFKAERYAAAAALFDQALDADPEDVFPLYYRGVTLTRLGEYARAIDDLERFLAARPNENQAALELGIALVSAQRHADAQPWLQRAQAVPELEARASFFLGLAQLRLDQRLAAEESFERAARDENLLLAARFYLGVIRYSRSEWDAAEECFTFVVETSPRSDMGNEARKYLEVIDQMRSTYHLHGELGVHYDSNVPLVPSDDDAVAVSGQEDGLVSITAGGTYTPWRSEQSTVSLGYEFYQSLHFDLSEFDLQDHRVRLGYATKLGRWELGLGGQYDYYLLDGDSLLQQPAVMPWLRFSEGDFGYTELLYWFRWRDYVKQEFEDDLDALRQSAGIRQYYYVDSADRKVWLEYRFDRNSAVHAEGRRFAYDRQQAGAGVDWRWRSLGIESSLGYWYHHDNFDSPSKTQDDQSEQLGERRMDNRNTLSVLLRKRLTKYIALSCGYEGIFNGSNQQLFQYDRNIASLAVEVDF